MFKWLPKNEKEPFWNFDLKSFLDITKSLVSKSPFLRNWKGESLLNFKYYPGDAWIDE